MSSSDPAPPSLKRPKLSKDGVRFVAHDVAWTRWTDVYHELMRSSWLFTITVLFLGWVFINGVFALLYLLGGDCIGATDPTSFLQAFSFSVQTSSSLGYGAMHPTTDWAHVVSNLEAFAGVLMVAVGTGLMFAKFSRPTARIEFADTLLLQMRDGQPSIVLRVANQRGNRIVQASMHLACFRDEQTPEGHTLRRLIDLPMTREQTPTFALSMTLVHPIDPSSPLAALTVDELREEVVSFVLTVSGLDDTFSQTVHAQHYYGPEQLAVDATFVDMLETTDAGMLAVHHSRLSQTRPMPEHPVPKGVALGQVRAPEPHPTA